MNRKVRFTIYGFLIMGILVWWWNIPEPVPQKKIIFATMYPNARLTDEMIFVKRDARTPEQEQLGFLMDKGIFVKRKDWTPKQEQLFKNYIQKNTQ